MKLDLKVRLDIYTLLIWTLLLVALFLISFKVIEFTKLTVELETLKELNKEYVFDYSCNEWDSKYYNCPTNESLKNITGNYCQGKMICQNSVRRIKQ